MSVVRGGEGEEESQRRRERERVMLEEGEALWRDKQRQQWISRLQDQREARDMLLSYAPWGRPGCGAPNNISDARKKKLQDLAVPGSQSASQALSALTMGRPGCGAPLRTRSGRLLTVVRSDPMLRFHEPTRRCVDNELRYHASPVQQLAYRSQLDQLVQERRKAQAEARKGSTQELRHMGWSSDPTLCELAQSVQAETAAGKAAEEAAGKEHHRRSDAKTVEPHVTKKHRARAGEPSTPGQGLVPLLARRRAAEGLFGGLHHSLSRHPLCSTDVTRHDVPGISDPRYHEDRGYLQELRNQVANKQKKLEEMRQSELIKSQQHFETWRQFWGRPGHGAPKLPVPRLTLADLMCAPP